MKIFLIISLNLLSFICIAQSNSPNILEARRSGVEFIKNPPKGILRVEVSEEYHNLVLFYICGFRGSFPIACREDYSVTMTTATGRVMTITDFTESSFGTIQPKEFPMIINVKVKALNGEERYPFEFSVKLKYSDFCYRIYLYDDWTNISGGIH